METVLIDTNIIVGHLRKDPAANSAIARMDGYTFVICDAVLAEVLAGSRNQAEFDRLHSELTSNFHILPFTMEVSGYFREIVRTTARERGIHFADYLIAATALAHDCPLLTLNKKHFTPINGLKLA